jgi:ABC-type multidrug transport system fused ATPase/permease subunit
MLILFMSVISVLIPHLFMPAVSKVMIEYWQDYADLNAQYIDSMQGMSTLKSLGVSKREGEKLADRAWGFQRESMKNLGISLSDSAVIVACTTIGTAVGIALAAWHMACGKLTYETLLVILFLAGETMKPLNEMNTYWHSSYLGLSVAEELFALLDEPQVLIEGKRYCRLDATVPGMCLQNVFFSYTEKGGKVLKNVTMEMYAGKITALVGKSGSGKSTIVSLLLRFFDAEEGTVMLDGKDVRDFPIEYLRNQISVVFQEPYIFYGTIRENLRMAKPDATDEELTEAAKLANAHEFIMEFQDGYDTLVGERGATLSGGERQRIAIARAILKAAPILILDEATSSVDMVHEAKIQEALNHCMKGKTTIVIAHRLSTIEHADVIYVLEEGCVTGKGTHEELLKGNQVYRRLIEAQKYA